MTQPLVAVVMGSKSDAGLMQECLDTLDRLGIPYETAVMSAHRQPDKVREFAQSARDRGIEVIIAAAGLAAHLPGVVAAWTPLPVIGVPLPAGELRGIDALYSMAQMPAGTPVACVAIGSHGARNAAHLAARILALKHETVRKSLEAYRQGLASE
jgi:5-(carboxyamino)imidazole ribonucleotide mutase